MEQLSSYLEKIFLITLDNEYKDSNKPSSCLYIGYSDDAASQQQIYIEVEMLDELLLKRLQMTAIDKTLIRKGSGSRSANSNNDLTELRPYFYLFGCIKRINKLKDELNRLNNDNYRYLCDLCFNLSKTIIYLSENPSTFEKDLVDLITEYFDKSAFETDCLTQYVQSFLQSFESEGEDCTFVYNIFDVLNKTINETNCDYFSSNLFRFIDIVQFLTQTKFMKLAFLKQSSPKFQREIGKSWQHQTIVGKLLTPHFLPISQQAKCNFFTKPTEITQHDVEIQEKNIWERQRLINQKQTEFLKHFIKTNSTDVRNKMLEWIGECIHANRNKAQEWSKYINDQHLYASDGFFLNLLYALLDLSQPFSKCYQPILLKIDPTYTLNTGTDFSKVHFKGFDKDTKFITHQSERYTPKSEYNFITECFYATHKCFQMSFACVYQKLMKINQELGRTQQMYNDLRQQFQAEQHEPVRQMRIIYETYLSQYLNLKVALTQPNIIEMSMKFLSASSCWLTHLAICDSPYTSDSGEIKQIEDISQLTKQSDVNKELLALVPEFLLNNVAEFLIFLSRFQDQAIETGEDNSQDLNAFMTLILIFMGNADLLFNPHSRASLAECLELLLPTKTGKQNISSAYLKQKRELLFTKHPCAAYLTEALLNVFVSIEMTGMAVQFEQKFNYRRPMYEILEYVWTLDIHKKKIIELAKYAKENIENTEQPLFLRFINLLINDSNYLLLESLLYLEKIKIKQQELKNSNLTQQERSSIDANLRHMIMLARFHNIMSTMTIRAFKLVTTEIGYFFCEVVLADRVAAMLNDFLLHLVGPKRRNFSVENYKEVEFNPQEIVSNISDIYLNLGKYDDFCKAVCRDGRSYSKELFPSAAEVLRRIHRPFEMVEKFEKLGTRIEDIAQIQSAEDSNYDDAPEEFLDPIMSNLMTDPVILPTSKKVIDRPTIARHLLSDQTDPFNRAPLNLQDVVPDVELKRRIEEWKASKRAKSSV